MAKTDTKKKETVNTAPIDHGDIAGGAVVVAEGGQRMRLPYPRSLGTAFDHTGNLEDRKYNVDQRKWQVLIDTVFPGARTIEAVCMAIAYCQSRRLDIMKKPVHIVPVWSKQLNREVETVWPSIAEIRITASRTGAYAGKDATVFGPTITRKFSHTHENKTEEVELDFPEWAQVTVYRLVQGVRCAFVGPKVFWMESYASKSKWSEVPNEMWGDRRSGQIEKCAEAASLRAAFPEELGNEYAAEEMHGRVIDTSQIQTFSATPKAEEVVTPREPARSDFTRGTTADTGEAKQNAKPAEKAKTDPKAPLHSQEVVDVVEERGEGDNRAGAGLSTTEEDEADGRGDPRDHGDGEEGDTRQHPETTKIPENESPFQRGMRLLLGITNVAEIPELQKSIIEELKPKAAKVWIGSCAARKAELEAKNK